MSLPFADSTIAVTDQVDGNDEVRASEKVPDVS